jgi:hypothetical protein
MLLPGGEVREADPERKVPVGMASVLNLLVWNSISALE